MSLFDPVSSPPITDLGGARANLNCQKMVCKESVIMISNVTLDSQLSSVVNTQCRTNALPSDFQELLRTKSIMNYDKMTEWAKGLWSKTVVHEIDSREINGLHRKDFPKALLFNKNMTLEELNKYSPTYPEPKSNWDPRAFHAGRKACMQNGVSILVSPQAVDRMNSDEEFYNYVMRQLEEKLYPSIQENMVGLPQVWTRGDFEYTSTDCSIIIEIDDNGYVKGEVMGIGECRRINEDEDKKNIDEIEYFTSRSFDKDEEIHQQGQHSPVDDQPILLPPELEINYNFLSCFNYSASSTMIEYRKRIK